MDLKAPTADALQSLAVGGAVAERWPLMQCRNAYGAREQQCS